jgi:hypothetical protein
MKKKSTYAAINNLPISKKDKQGIATMLYAMSMRDDARKKGYKKFSDYLKNTGKKIPAIK